MEIEKDYIVKKCADSMEEKLWWMLQDLYVDCLKDNSDKREIIEDVLKELLYYRVWNILSMLKQK